MKSIRSRLAVPLLAFALLGCADLLAADPPMPGTRPGRASELYEKALVEYNLGEPRTAYLHLKDALLEDPFLLSAHLLLGKLYLQFGYGDKAEKELMIAAGLGADKALTLVPLARAYLLQGKAEKLLSELFPLGTLSEEDAEILALRGQAHLQLEQRFDAQRAFAQSLGRNPNNVSAMLGRVQVLLLDGELNEANFYIRRAVELAPNNPAAWHLKGLLDRTQGDTQGALLDFERAAKALPAYFPAQMARASLLLRLGRPEQARDVAKTLAQLYPRDPRVYYLQATIDGRQQALDAAADSLKQAEALISQMPRELIEGHAPTLLLAGMVSYSLKRWDQAVGYLSLYLQKYPDSVGPRTLLAQIYLDRHREEEAVKLLEYAEALAPGDQRVLSLLAEAYMRQGQHVQASQLLQQATEAGEDNIVLQTQRAVNRFALGRQAQGIEELGLALEDRPNLANATATLVVMNLQEHRFAEAVAAARTLAERNPGNLTYLNLYGVAELAAGNAEAARWAFELTLALDWTFVPAQLNLAELDLRDDRPAVAADRLERVLMREPEHVSGMLMMARALEARGQREEARQWAERAVSTDPTAVPIAVYLTNLLLKMKESEQALTVAETMEVRAADSEDLDLLAALSRAYIANGRRATAQVVLQRGSALAGYDAASLLEIANLQRQAGDTSGAVWSLEKAAKGQPGYLPTRIKLGELYAEVGRLDDATALAKTLAADFPKQPYGEHLLGVVAQQRGDHRAALDHFTRALKLEDSPVLAVRAYETIRAVQGANPAIDFLLGWIKKHPNDEIARQALAEGLYRAGRIEDAQAIYRKALAESPNNPTLLNNLALSYARDRRSEAVQLARKARELAPASPEIADTLGWLMVLDGQTGEGLKLLREAQARAPDDPAIDYHLADALQRLGRQGEARRALAQALNSSRPFAERADAEKLRQRMEAASDTVQPQPVGAGSGFD